MDSTPTVLAEPVQPVPTDTVTSESIPRAQPGQIYPAPIEVPYFLLDPDRGHNLQFIVAPTQVLSNQEFNEAHHSTSGWRRNLNIIIAAICSLAAVPAFFIPKVGSYMSVILGSFAVAALGRECMTTGTNERFTPHEGTVEIYASPQTLSQS